MKRRNFFLRGSLSLDNWEILIDIHSHLSVTSEALENFLATNALRWESLQQAVSLLMKSVLGTTERFENS